MSADPPDPSASLGGEPENGSSEGRREEAPTSSRFKRFTRLSGLTAGITARHLGQKVADVFRDDASREAAARKNQAKSASEITKTLGELKGAAMKIGQMMATDPELLPKEMVDEIKTLQHAAPPMPFATVKSVVEEALGAPLATHFESFSEAPIGAASIGQVHRARTIDGVDVAVKVQYPGIAATIRSDMKNLGSLLTVLRAQLPKERVDGYLEEFTSVLERESDYVRESESLERFHFITGKMPGVVVPTPVHELTRPNVLVMEFFDGIRLEEWLATATPAQKQVQGRRLVEVFLQTIHRNQVLHADPHPGNFLVLHKEADVDGAPPLGILDAGCFQDFEPAFTDGLIRFMNAMWRHDLEALKGVWEDLGFIDHGVDPELIYEWNALILGPLLENKVWDFANWKIQEKAMKFVLAHPSVKLWSPPREALFYLRTLVGLRGLVASCELKLNTYEMAREMAVERGIIPGKKR